MEIGKRIKSRREELGMSLQDIAERIGVAKSTIQRYEAGLIQKIKLPVIEAMAKALDVNPVWLLGKSEKKETEDMREYMKALKERQKLKNIFKILVRASDADIDKLIRIAEAIVE